MNTNPITAIVAMAVDSPKKHIILTLSDRVSHVSSKNGYSDVMLLGPDGIGPVSGVDMNQSEYQRWATVEFEGNVYFTNPDTQILKLTAGPFVERLGGQNVLVKPTKVFPAARYIKIFFDHLVVGNVNFNGVFPNRCQWSNLKDFGNWSFAKESEADYYDMLDGKSGVQLGLTGLDTFGEFLVAYKSTGIWIASYVGMPNVMRWSERVKDVGNDFPWAVVSIDRYHFFISESWESILLFDGTDTPQPIGDPISPLFFDDLTTDPEFRYRVWGYVDKSAREVIWAYVSKASDGDFDREIVFSVRDKKWYQRSCENVHSFCQAVQVGKTVHSLAGTIDELTGTCNQLGRGDSFDKFWGTGEGVLLEEVSGPDVGVLTAELPYLETPDFFYGELESIKEVESMCIQAGLGTATAFEVFVSTRSQLEDPVVYSTVPQQWVPTLREGRLSLPRTSGRFIRYKFRPVGAEDGVDGVIWKNFVENVYGAKQVEK